MTPKPETKPETKPDRAAPAAGDGRLYSIGELSAEFGISTRAIRFYESKGLMAPERVGSNRIYTRRDRARLILVLRGKRLGFSLEEIAEYLNLYDADPNQIAQTRMLLQKTESSISELEGKRRDLDEALGELRDIRGQCIAQLKSQNGG
jgi:DNA-binding transcriptional MerR regulator